MFFKRLKNKIIQKIKSLIPKFFPKPEPPKEPEPPGWLEPPMKPEPPVPPEGPEDPPILSEIVIYNFQKLIQDMAEDGYQLQFSHSFGGTNKRTASGYSSKLWSASKLVGFGASIGGALQEAIDAKGVESVAMAIIDNGETLQQIAEDLIFAIYDSSYSAWGGGRDEYEAVLEFEFKGLLMSGPDYSQSGE